MVIQYFNPHHAMMVLSPVVDTLSKTSNKKIAQFIEAHPEFASLNLTNLDQGILLPMASCPDTKEIYLPKNASFFNSNSYSNEGRPFFPDVIQIPGNRHFKRPQHGYFIPQFKTGPHFLDFSRCDANGPKISPVFSGTLMKSDYQIQLPLNDSHNVSATQALAQFIEKFCEFHSGRKAEPAHSIRFSVLQQKKSEFPYVRVDGIVFSEMKRTLDAKNVHDDTVKDCFNFALERASHVILKAVMRGLATLHPRIFSGQMIFATNYHNLVFPNLLQLTPQAQRQLSPLSFLNSLLAHLKTYETQAIALRAEQALLKGAETFSDVSIATSGIEDPNHFHYNGIPIHVDWVLDQFLGRGTVRRNKIDDVKNVIRYLEDLISNLTKLNSAVINFENPPFAIYAPLKSI